MICNKCGTMNTDNSRYCKKCGNDLALNVGYKSYDYNANINQHAGYRNDNVNNVQYVPVVPQKDAPSIGTYILWFIIPAIPLVGLILSIVFAVDTSDMNRANYFRAIFVMYLILILIVAVIGGIMFAAGASLMESVLYSIM